MVIYTQVLGVFFSYNKSVLHQKFKKMLQVLKIIIKDKSLNLFPLVLQ